ncbi:MAG TPA: class I SAM-dependent methyltransferase, partial [Gemmataceae bacterium]|nr:class I SAM-dependent methyltransferase [Gemmataceae bacterium]
MLTHRTADLVADPDPTPDRPRTVAWEETPCPLCGLDEAALLLEAPDAVPAAGEGLWFAVVRCENCGLTYTNPRPTPETIGQFYPPDYRPHRRPRKMDDSRSARPLWSRVFGRPCNERRGTLPWHGHGRLLDFGCGGGGFLKRMADRGWQVIGLDAAVGAVRRVQEELGLKALVGSLPHPDLSPCSFDVVTMWHSLEHVHEPLAILREAYQLLVPGGKLVVATPNIESLPFYWFGRSWFGLDLPRHLTHFTPATLDAMLQTAGFQVEVVRGLRHSDWLRSSARLAVKQGRGGWRAKALTWKPLAKLVAWGCYATGLSDCMMA